MAFGQIVISWCFCLAFWVWFCLYLIKPLNAIKVAIVVVANLAIVRPLASFWLFKILSKSANGSLNIISERFPIEKVVWSVCALVILGLLFRSAKSITDYENSIVIKKDIKDREIELYRNFQKELDNMPKINSKIKNAYATNIMPRSRRNYKELARR